MYGMFLLLDILLQPKHRFSHDFEIIDIFWSLLVCLSLISLLQGFYVLISRFLLVLVKNIFELIRHLLLEGHII